MTVLSNGMTFLVKNTCGMFQRAIPRLRYEIDLLVWHTDAFMKKRTKQAVLECTAYPILTLIMSYNASPCKKKIGKLNFVEHWISQLYASQLSLKERRKRSLPVSATETGLTGGSLGDWCSRDYRRRDHLICSLADWRTCGRKLSWIQQITQTTRPMPSSQHGSGLAAVMSEPVVHAHVHAHAHVH